MNNSNNIFDNNGITPQQPNNIPNGNIPEAPSSNEIPSNQNIAPMQQPSNNSTQSNNNISNELNSVNTTVIKPPVNQQITTPQNQNLNNVTQNSPSNNNLSDDELLKAFIGKNYEKITTRPFNIAGFFFTTFYMFYRKMFLYGILLFIVNLIISNFIIKNSFIISILLGVLVGFLINKIYLYYAKKKIDKIKLENPQKSNEELKNICSTKGGTSVGKIFLGFFAQFGIAFLLVIIMMLIGLSSFVGDLFNLDNWDITINGNKINSGDDTNNSSPSTQATGTLLENVTVNGYSCLNSKCTISIEDSKGTTTDYIMNSNDELFKALNDYKDYIKVNIYYTSNGSEKTISSYKIYLKSNNEDISSIKTEDELRSKIGLYSLGTHTDTFTLKEIGTTGFGLSSDASYNYTSYTFVDSKNIEYEMKYINSNGTLKLTEGNKYTVTFEVVEGTFDYEFNIKSVK